MDLNAVLISCYFHEIFEAQICWKFLVSEMETFDASLSLSPSA